MYYLTDLISARDSTENKNGCFRKKRFFAAKALKLSKSFSEMHTILS